MYPIPFVRSYQELLALHVPDGQITVSASSLTHFVSGYLATEATDGTEAFVLVCRNAESIAYINLATLVAWASA